MWRYRQVHSFGMSVHVDNHRPVPPAERHNLPRIYGKMRFLMLKSEFYPPRSAKHNAAQCGVIARTLIQESPISGSERTPSAPSVAVWVAPPIRAVSVLGTLPKALQGSLATTSRTSHIQGVPAGLTPERQASMDQVLWLRGRLADPYLDHGVLLTFSRAGSWMGLRVLEGFQLSGDGRFRWEWEDAYRQIPYQHQIGREHV